MDGMYIDMTMISSYSNDVFLFYLLEILLIDTA